MASLDKLPDDVLTSILIRLPAKLLAQMRCVSKPFNDLLSQPSFVKSHLKSSVRYDDEILMVFQRYPFRFDHLPFTAHTTKSPDRQLKNFIKIPANAPKFADCYVVGSVNGLICFYYQPYHVCTPHIWNPSLSALLALPPYTMPSRSCDIIFRFGFDPKTNDYKVVKLTSLVPPPRIRPRPNFPPLDYLVREWLQVEVYSMRKGCWNIIAQRFPSHVKWILDNNEVCLDGHDGYIHWLGYLDEEGKSQTIVAYDLCVETFKEISLPDFKEHRKNVLGVLAGKLCVMSKVLFGKSYEVWVMNEYGVVESWVKRHVLSHFDGYISPFGFTLNNELLFQKGQGFFTLYDLVKGNAKSFDPTTAGPPRDVDSHKTKIIQYVDSLVWVAPSKCGSAVDRKFKRKNCITSQEIVRKSKRLNKLPPKLNE